MDLIFKTKCKLSNDALNDSVDWCHKNIGTRPKDLVYCGHGTYSNLWILEFSFRTEEQRMLFELTWI